MLVAGGFARTVAGRGICHDQQRKTFWRKQMEQNIRTKNYILLMSFAKRSEVAKVLCVMTVLAYVFLAEYGKRDLLDNILLAAMGIALKRQIVPCVVERRNERIM